MRACRIGDRVAWLTHYLDPQVPPRVSARQGIVEDIRPAGLRIRWLTDDEGDPLRVPWLTATIAPLKFVRLLCPHCTEPLERHVRVENGYRCLFSSTLWRTNE